jgi:type IV secretory pathway VirB3-like protein
MQQMNGETSFDQAVLLVSLAVEFAGVAIIVVGFLVATLHVIRRLLRGNDGEHLTVSIAASPRTSRSPQSSSSAR